VLTHVCTSPTEGDERKREREGGGERGERKREHPASLPIRRAFLTFGSFLLNPQILLPPNPSALNPKPQSSNARP